MASEQDRLRAQVSALFTKIVSAHRQQGEAIAELHKLLSGVETAGQKARRLFETWATAWERRYHSRYIFTKGRDAGIMTRLLKALPEDEIERRMLAFLRSDDPFAVKARHGLNVFAACINQFTASAGELGGGVEMELSAAPSDCRHQPPCRSDAEHTERKMRDNRA